MRAVQYSTGNKVGKKQGEGYILLQRLRVLAPSLAQIMLLDYKYSA